MRVLIACEFSGTVRPSLFALSATTPVVRPAPAEDGDTWIIQGDCLP